MALPHGLRQIALFDRTTSAPGLGAMVVLDKEGTIILVLCRPGSRGNFGDREYSIQRDTPHPDGFYISRPFEARLQQLIWSLSISRRFNAPDGSLPASFSGTLKLDFSKQRCVHWLGRWSGYAARDDGSFWFKAQRAVALSARIGARPHLFNRLRESPWGRFPATAMPWIMCRGCMPIAARRAAVGSDRRHCAQRKCWPPGGSKQFGSPPFSPRWLQASSCWWGCLIGNCDAGCCRERTARWRARTGCPQLSNRLGSTRALSLLAAGRDAIISHSRY